MKRPRQSAARQNAGPLALFGFVVNVTASFFRQFSRHISTWEKELNRRRQTLKPLENQGFFRLSLLYRNGTPTPACSLLREWMYALWRACWGTHSPAPHWTFTAMLSTRTKSSHRRSWPRRWDYKGKGKTALGIPRAVLVRLTGLEPAAFRVGAERSIQAELQTHMYENRPCRTGFSYLILVVKQ